MPADRATGVGLDRTRSPLGSRWFAVTGLIVGLGSGKNLAKPPGQCLYRQYAVRDPGPDRAVGWRQAGSGGRPEAAGAARVLAVACERGPLPGSADRCAVGRVSAAQCQRV